MSASLLFAGSIVKYSWPRVVVALLWIQQTACSQSPPGIVNSPAPGGTLATAADAFFTSSNATIRYRTFGSGEPVVLLHGFGSSLAWPRTADSLALDYRVVVLDLRGFGLSTKFASASEYGPKMAEDVVRLLDYLQVDRAHVIGHSLGALIAAYIAQHHSNRVSSLSLVAGPFWPDSTVARRAVTPWVAGLESGRRLRVMAADLGPTLGDSVWTVQSDNLMARNDSAALVGVLKSLPALVPNRQLAVSDIPILVLAGTSDPLLQYSVELSRRWPGVRFAEAAGATHGSVVTHEAFLTEVRGILRARRRTR